MEGSSLILTLQLAHSPLSFCPPLVSQMITARLQKGTLSTDSLCLISGSPAFRLINTCIHTHTHAQLYNCMPANVHSGTHISQFHMPVHTSTKLHTHTRTRTDACSHPGVPWRLVRCAVLQDWIISQLWVGQPRICPNPRRSVQIASHTHTHSRPGPSPAEGFTKFVLFVCSRLSLLFFLFFLPRLHQALSFPVLWSQIGKATVKTA